MTRRVRKNFTFDDEITLIKRTFADNDKGEQIPTISESKVLASVQNVYGADFYAAANVGLSPSVKFVIKYLEYKEEEEVIFNEKRYKVLRTFRVDNEDIELECEKYVAKRTVQ